MIPGPSRRLFLASFTALFLELMIVRWAPATVHLIAYYANLMLISSFLGLGIGAMAAARRRFFSFFPAVLCADVALMLLCRHAVVHGGALEMRFGSPEAGRLADYLILAAVFVSNAAVFVPLGQKIGELLESQPPLSGYSWDLGGSLCGSAAFAWFSFAHFSPAAGLALAMAAYLLLCDPARRLKSLVFFTATLSALALTTERGAIWSSYYYVLIRDASGAVVTTPPPALRTMDNPTIYTVSVNHDFYQPDQTIDPRRYKGPQLAAFLGSLADAYRVPYAFGGPARNVLVLGAGGGSDAEAALLFGARHVDAVEIDPVLVGLSHRFNPSGIYEDPRVDVHVDDARAYVQKAGRGYDRVIFGFLDSQALFSQMSDIRLDGYVYTVESMRRAYALLGDDGMLAVSFMAGREWLADKLVRMLRDATGRLPIIYVSGGQVILCAPRGAIPEAPANIGRFRRVRPDMPLEDIAPPTDDWPYLYLSRPAVPRDYLTVIGILLAVSIFAVGLLRGRGFGAEDAHFLFMGLGFMLLETKSIADCSLYFGATWITTAAVVIGMLLMALAANAAAPRFKGITVWAYAPLLAALVALFFAPSGLILARSLPLRLAWMILAAPLPAFFAGLVFSSSFRAAPNRAALFGANLIGAMLGGFLEYLSMAAGRRSLTLVLIAAYAASFVCLRVWRRRDDS
ncbi:MAG: spermidine synthase [Elusimicrobiota bacterium]